MKKQSLKTRVRKLPIQHEKILTVDIWQFCDQPRELVEGKSRKTEHIKWRHLRNFIAYIQSGYHGRECARKFGMTSATFISSVRNVCASIESKEISEMFLSYLKIKDEITNKVDAPERVQLYSYANEKRDVVATSEQNKKNTNQKTTRSS
jgi:hypothetical protein